MSRVKFGDVVKRININVDRFNTDRLYYIGKGATIEPNALTVEPHGRINATLGFKFHFGFNPGHILFMSRCFDQHKAATATFAGICSDSTYVVETKDESVLLQRYLQLEMQSDRFWRWCEEHKSGGVNYLINYTTLETYEFYLPSLAEQKVLAEKLWAAYEVKQSYLKMIAATEEMVKAQFVEMFKGFFPKMSWDECLTITNGKKYDGDYQESGTYPICGSGGIMGYGNQMLCPKETIILGRKGNINSPIYMETDYWIVDTAFCLDVDRVKLHPKYFYFWCKSFDFTRYNKQGVLPSLTKKDLLKIEMPIPPMKLQTRFVDIIEQSDKSISELRKSVDAIDKVIKSLINENL